MNPDNASPKGHRLWFPFGLGLLAIAGIGVLNLQPDLERNAQIWLTAAITLLAAVLGMFWLVFLSRLRWRTRLITFAILIATSGALAALLKVDGTGDGRGLPRLVWKWSTPAMRKPTVGQTIRSTAMATTATAALPITDVPQFFGPNRDGIVRGARLQSDWQAHAPRELWRQPVGAGWSAFAVVNGRAFTQEQQGGDELVTSYDVLTGRWLWAYTNHVRFHQWQGGEGPRATPTLDRGQVFAFGATGLLDCLEAETGRRVWSRDVLGENRLPNLTWGVSGSPLVFDEAVVVAGGSASGPTLLAYHRQTGEPLWRSGNDKASYASPVLAALAGRQVILSVNAASLTAHNPKTGKVVLNYSWSTDKWPKASQPVVLDNDRVFLSSGYGVGCVMLKVRATAEGALAVEELWKNSRMKAQFNSVAGRNGFIYGLDDGLLACVEIATGERKWKDGRYGSGQTLLVDDLVLIQSEPGAVVLAEARPEGFRELGRIPALSAKTWNHPTLAGRYLLVRNSEEMACYELPVAEIGK